MANSIPTERELEILRLIRDGLSTKEIAHRLNIALKTAACHRSRLMIKSGARNAIHLLEWAIKNGFVSPG
jgi:DNA-binding NarL/FixJ family response regulator